MSDTPVGPTGQEEPAAYAPSGLRRSTYTPPPADAPAPIWDDDALAAALEEQVRTYTAPITLPVLDEAGMGPIEPLPTSEEREPAAEAEPVAPPASPPAVEERAHAASASEADPPAEPVAGPTPALAESVRPFSWGGPTATPGEPGAPGSAPRFEEPPADQALEAERPSDVEPLDDDQLIRDLEGAPTAEAIQRLESELSRRAVATGETPVAPVVAPFFAGKPPVSPPAPGLDPERGAAEPEPAGEFGPEPERDLAPEGPAESAVETSAPQPAGPEPWNSAPPPLYAPPPLVEPQAQAPGAPTPPGGRLLPPPTDLPDVARRAELPPPPGYADDGTHVPVATEVRTATAPSGWGQLLADVVPTVPAPAPTPTADEENDDVVDESDRVPSISGSAMEPRSTTDDVEAGSAVEPPLPYAPDSVTVSEPVGDQPVAAPEPVTGPEPGATPGAAPLSPGESPAAGTDTAADTAADPDPRGPAAFAIETIGAEPTPLEQRVGRAARLFWLWFAANASILSVALGAVMIGTGMSLRQAVVAVVIGIALSFIPLGFTTLAGKWNAQPTLVLSRAAFGVSGNVLPTVLAILVRVFWGGVLLWLLGEAVGSALVDGHADAGMGATRWAIIAIAVALVLTAGVAAFGYGLLARVQLVLSIVAGVLIVLAAVVTLPKVRLDVALTHQDGSWLLVAGGAVMVFSFIGLAWAFSGSDVARYQRPSGSGASSMLWATFGATIPPFLLIGWGALLAASDQGLAAGLATHPFTAIAAVLPSWALIPLLLAAVVGLLSGTALTIYSGGFALQNLTPRLPRITGVIVASLLALVLAAALVLLDAQARTIVTDLAVTLAVPVAAWTGIFAAEMMVRQRRFHSASLLAVGGVYPIVRWPNLIGLVIISGVGYAFVTGGQHWLGWEGFGWRLLGVAAGDPLASVDLGVVFALVLGIVLPLASAVPAVRRQESVQVGPVAARI